MSDRPHVVIVGGGIAGLRAAYALASVDGARRPRITLLEADDRLGGKIRTEPFAGRALDVGAEALLVAQPAALALCRELGLAESLVAPRSDQAFVWLDRLRPLPPRLLAGSPGGAGAIIRSGILSPVGLVRAGLDLVRRSAPLQEDISIGELVRGRLGDEVLERLIDPLLGGIHAGRCDELSVRATAPQLEAAVRPGRGLVRGLRALAADAPPPPGARPASPFMTVRGGLQTLVDALVARLDGVDVRTGTRVTRVEPLADGRYQLVLGGGDDGLIAAHVILAVPAHAAARMLEHASPPLAEALDEIEYASVATVALAYAPGTISLPPGGSGFLVPRTQGRTITASTWSSAKWEHLGGGDVLLKCAIGHAGTADAEELGDEELLAAVRRDLAAALGVDVAPRETMIVRFPSALPQYRVGHLERITRIDAALAQLPGVHLAGAAYRGVGVAACIRDGAAAAERVAAGLLSTPPSRQTTQPEPEPEPGVRA